LAAGSQKGPLTQYTDSRDPLLQKNHAYFIQLINDQGEIVDVRKIVVEWVSRQSGRSNDPSECKI